jgi:hypothetical protein
MPSDPPASKRTHMSPPGQGLEAEQSISPPSCAPPPPGPPDELPLPGWFATDDPVVDQEPVDRDALEALLDVDQGPVDCDALEALLDELDADAPPSSSPLERAVPPHAAATTAIDAPKHVSCRTCIVGCRISGALSGGNRSRVEKAGCPAKIVDQRHGQAERAVTPRPPGPQDEAEQPGSSALPWRSLAHASRPRRDVPPAENRGTCSRRRRRGGLRTLRAHAATRRGVRGSDRRGGHEESHARRARPRHRSSGSGCRRPLRRVRDHHRRRLLHERAVERLELRAERLGIELELELDSQLERDLGLDPHGIRFGNVEHRIVDADDLDIGLRRHPAGVPRVPSEQRRSMLPFSLQRHSDPVLLRLPTGGPRGPQRDVRDRGRHVVGLRDLPLRPVDLVGAVPVSDDRALSLSEQRPRRAWSASCAMSAKVSRVAVQFPLGSQIRDSFPSGCSSR